MKRNRGEMIPLTSYDQVPDGMSEDEAHEFWSTHEITEEYLASAPPVPEDSLPPAGQLREYGPVLLDREVFRKARWLARQQGMSLETLLETLVDDAVTTTRRRRTVTRA